MTETRLLEEAKELKEERDKTGVVYISRIPPLMSPHEIRNLLSPFGPLGRVYLTPQDGHKKGAAEGAKRVGRNKFVDGWVEFLNKKHAKNAALALNGLPMGGKKSYRFHDELWSIRYLSKFKWHHLTEQISLDNAVREQKLRADIAQAKRTNTAYLQRVDQAHLADKIKVKRAAAGQEPLASKAPRFKQRAPINVDKN